jgi:hypothetical protein
MDGPYIATLNVTTPGVHVVNIWVREDGIYIDTPALSKFKSSKCCKICSSLRPSDQP